MRCVLGLTMLVLLGACEQRDERRAEGEAVERAVHNSGHVEATPTPTPTVSATPTPAVTATGTATTDAWIGRWRGVEGTYLDIATDPERGPGHYTLAMQYTLDDKGSFDGTAQGDTIRFTRPDGEKTLRATDGEATGLKWLAGKQDCLTVETGEGYCRD